MSGPISFGYQNLGFGGGSALDPGQLVFIQKSTVSASSSVDMTDVFTTDYGMYLLQYTHFFSAEDTGNLEIKFFNASGVVSGSSYNWVANEMKSNATWSEVKASGASLIDSLGAAGTTQANSGGGYIVIGNPAQARGTITMGNGGGISDDESRFYNMLNIGGLATAEAHTGIRFQNAGHNITGTFKLYAYKDS